MHTTDTPAEEIASLERLAGELATHGLQTALRQLPGRLPYLDVRNPRASILTEKVFAQADAYWYSWAERIAGCDDVTAAAAILARVLRTVDGD